jgi:GNAT superfamily N-acetyltransferase
VGEVLVLCTRSGAVRSGLGRRLMVFLVQRVALWQPRCRELVLNADLDSGADRFWSRLGFQPRRHPHADDHYWRTVPMVASMRTLQSSY